MHTHRTRPHAAIAAAGLGTADRPRRAGLIAACSVAAALTLAGCSVTPAAPSSDETAQSDAGAASAHAEAASASEVSGVSAAALPAEPLMAPVEGDPHFACGYASALNGMLTRSVFQHGAGTIDEATYQARLDLIAQTVQYGVWGENDVTAAFSALQTGVVAQTALPGTAEFDARLGDVNAACAAAGSIIAVAALPEMGG